MKDAFKVLMASGGDAPPPDAVLSKVRACYHEKEGYNYICGLEFIYTKVVLDPWSHHTYRKKCGKIIRGNMSEAIGFSEEGDIEHIIGGEFDGNDIKSLKLYTSYNGGRVVSFSVSSDGINTFDGECGEYHGCYESTKEGIKLSPHSNKRGRNDMKKFLCPWGKRVTEFKFNSKYSTIKRIKQEMIPEGQNERWWEKSYDGVYPEKPYEIDPNWGKKTEEDDDTEDEDDSDYDVWDDILDSEYEEDGSSIEADIVWDTDIDGEGSINDNRATAIPKLLTTLPPQSFSEIRHQYRNHEDVSFLRPDGSTESKSIDWCLSNGFFQVEEGLWSGPWFYKKYPATEYLHDDRVIRTEEIREMCENIDAYDDDCDEYGYGYDDGPSYNKFDYHPDYEMHNMLKRERYMYQEGMYQRALQMYGTEDDTESKPKKKKRKKSKSKKKEKSADNGKATGGRYTSDEQKLLCEEGWHCETEEEQMRKDRALRSLKAKMVSEALQVKDAEITKLKSQLHHKVSSAQNDAKMCKEDSSKALEVSKRLEAENSKLKAQMNQMRTGYCRSSAEDQIKIKSLKKDLFDSSCELGELQRDNRRLEHEKEKYEAYTKLTLAKLESILQLCKIVKES